VTPYTQYLTSMYEMARVSYDQYRGSHEFGENGMEQITEAIVPLK
jgi:hypothetical protein